MFPASRKSHFELKRHLQLPEDFFRSRHTCRGSSGLTMLNYPPPPESTLITHTDIRAGAHKDWGSVTLLFQEDGGQPGLEIFLPDPITSAESVAAGGVKLMSQVDLSAGVSATFRLPSSLH